MADFTVGQTATNAKGEKVKFDGSNWVRVAGSGGGAGGGGKKMSPQAQAFLNGLSTQAAEAGETRRVYERARSDVKTLQPGPYRGAFLDAALPTENGGFLDKLGAVVIGAPARVTGMISPKEVDAYQHLKGLQSQQVLQSQIAQKGPQTESDAARMQLTEISPGKTAAVNNDVINQGIAKTDRVRAKAVFYTQFANKWGPNGVTPHGYTADQIWARMGPGLTKQILGQQAPAPKAGIRVISRTKVR